MAKFSPLGGEFFNPRVSVPQDRYLRLQNPEYSRNFRTRFNTQLFPYHCKALKGGMAWTSMSESVHKYK